MSVRPLLWLFAAALVIGACGDDEPNGGQAAPGSDVPTIVVTTSIWADVVGNVACDDLARVETLIPDGGDPHQFELSLADRGRLDDADVVVANGLDLEASLDDALAGVEGEGGTVIRVGELTDPLPYATADDTVDPHLWFDPQRVSSLLPVLGTRIAQSTGIDPDAVGGCVGSYRAELDAIDRDVEARVDALPPAQRVLVTNHDSLGYFAERYGFEVVGTVLPSPSGLAEGNPAALEALAEEMTALGVPAVFSEAQHADDDAQALADRIGSVEVVELNTGSLGEDGTYLALLDTTAVLVVDALR